MEPERRRKQDADIEVLTERVDNWMQSTTEYRQALCAKIDGINNRLNQLSCKEQNEKVRGLRVDVDRLIVAAWAIVMVLFAGGAAWGTLNHQVDVNTRKWEIIEPEHRSLIVDVSTLKDKSYGYRNIPVKPE